MSEMKTLTINGKKYTVADPDAATINDPVVGQNAWSSKNIVDRLCPAFTESGAVATCQPVAGYPLEVVSHIRPAQAGNGDPSPENVRPITGHTQVKLTRSGGKNLLDITRAENSVTTVNGNVIRVTVPDDAIVPMVNSGSIPIHIPANTYFTISGKVLAAESTDWVIYGSGPGAHVEGLCDKSSVKPDGTFAISRVANNSVYTSVYILVNDGYLELTDLQLELGGETDYEPYRGDTFTLDLGQTVYGGSLNWKTGELTVDKNVQTFKGTEKWTYSTPKDGYCRIQYSGGGVFSKETRVCSHYIMRSGYSESYTFPYLRCNDGTSNWVYEGKEDGGYFASAEDFKAYLAEQYAAGTPVQVICKMAAPVTVQLTQQEILALSGTNNLYSNTGDTDVSGKADPQVVIADLYDKINQLLTNAVNNA